MFAALRARAWELIRLPGRWRYRGALKARPLTPACHEPALSYGGALPREAGAFVAGGRVKLRHLDRTFPEREDFNLLYLVSSAMPEHALELVRWAKGRGVKFVWNQNGVAFPAWAGSRLAETNDPMAALRREADFVVYQSAFCCESAERFLGANAAPSQVLFNPVDLREFSPAPSSGPVACWNLLAAGTHYQAPRVLVPLEALARLRETGCPAHLTVAGALRWPNAEAEVQAAIERLKLAGHVTLRPAFSQTEAVELYRAAHVLIHAKYHDPCPTVVIEALACGLPVIGSRSGGLPELVGEDGGELIDVPLSWDRAASPDGGEVANAVMKVILNWPVRSRAARARAERLFDAERWVAAHRAIFEKLLGA
jgi:glycosyltransferase involved in cell wall biosynthesis